MKNKFKLNLQLFSEKEEKDILSEDPKDPKENEDEISTDEKEEDLSDTEILEILEKNRHVAVDNFNKKSRDLENEYSKAYYDNKAAANRELARFTKTYVPEEVDRQTLALLKRFEHETKLLNDEFLRKLKEAKDRAASSIRQDQQLQDYFKLKKEKMLKDNPSMQILDSLEKEMSYSNLILDIDVMLEHNLVEDLLSLIDTLVKNENYRALRVLEVKAAKSEAAKYRVAERIEAHREGSLERQLERLESQIESLERSNKYPKFLKFKQVNDLEMFVNEKAYGPKERLSKKDNNYF